MGRGKRNQAGLFSKIKESRETRRQQREEIARLKGEVKTLFNKVGDKLSGRTYHSMMGLWEHMPHATLDNQLTRLTTMRDYLAIVAEKNSPKSADTVEDKLQEILNEEQPKSPRHVTRTYIWRNPNVKQPSPKEQAQQEQKSKSLMSDMEEELYQHLIAAPASEHKLGFSRNVTIEDYNNNPLIKEVSFYDQPQIGETMTVKTDKLLKIVEEWGPSPDNDELITQIKSLQNDGQTELEMELTSFGISTVDWNSTISKEESKTVFPYLLDEEQNPLIDDSITLTLNHPHLGDVPTLEPWQLDLPEQNSRVSKLEKVYSADPEQYQESDVFIDDGISIRDIDKDSDQDE
jgi:hypothetical protein